MSMSMKRHLFFIAARLSSSIGSHGFFIPLSLSSSYLQAATNSPATHRYISSSSSNSIREKFYYGNLISRKDASFSSSFNTNKAYIKSTTTATAATTSSDHHPPQNEITVKIELESQTQYSELLEQYINNSNNNVLPNNSANENILFLGTPEDVSTYIDENFDYILFDCDGVLYRGTDPIPNAARAIRSLMSDNDDDDRVEGGGDRRSRKKRKRCLFVTNNAGINRRELRDKLTMILVGDDSDGDDLLLEEEQMVCASYSAARYLQSVFEKQRDSGGDDDDDDDVSCTPNIHVIGTSGLCEELRSMGFTVSGGPSSSNEKTSMSRDELASYSFMEEEKGRAVDAVVVGLDTEFNYRKLCIANVLLQRHPNALLIATNEDAYDLVGADARHLPGNGALIKAIEHASQREAINVGKPSSILAKLLMEEHGIVDTARVLMVGDRLDTDVRFGRDGGMMTALVLTGCTTVGQLKGFMGTEEEPLPHIIFPHMGMMAT